MSAPEVQKQGKSNDQDDIVAAVRKIIAGLPDAAGLHNAVQEGKQIADIVAPLGLSQEIIAAVHIYPLFREKLVDSNSLFNNELSNISRYVLGLEQLNQFSLPENWPSRSWLRSNK